MAVDVEVTRALMREELAFVGELALVYNWEVVPNLGALWVLVRMWSHKGDPFILEVALDNYREWPPLFEFIDPRTGERGSRYAYPKSNDSFFHVSGPCICAPFNRKAYKVAVDTGPHADWTYGDWTTSKSSGFDWSNVSTLGGMLQMVQTRLILPHLYQGRLGE